MSAPEYFTLYKSSSYTPPFFAAMNILPPLSWLVQTPHVTRLEGGDWLVVGDTEMNCASLEYNYCDKNNSATPG